MRWTCDTNRASVPLLLLLQPRGCRVYAYFHFYEPNIDMLHEWKRRKEWLCCVCLLVERSARQLVTTLLSWPSGRVAGATQMNKMRGVCMRGPRVRVQDGICGSCCATARTTPQKSKNSAQICCQTFRASHSSSQHTPRFSRRQVTAIRIGCMQRTTRTKWPHSIRIARRRYSSEPIHQIRLIHRPPSHRRLSRFPLR